MQMSQQEARQRLQNAKNNARGHDFEEGIKAACVAYHSGGRAKIDKTPEPFRVMEKSGGGIFKGRFTAPAQPDFQGTIAGGRSIVFEAKYTTTDRIRREILTAEQMNTLEDHEKCGAVAGVCAGIGDKFFFIPWGVWRDMKQCFGRQYIAAADIEYLRVRFTGAVLFLDFVHEENGRWFNG
jgi:recombination protein U